MIRGGWGWGLDGSNGAASSTSCIMLGVMSLDNEIKKNSSLYGLAEVLLSLLHMQQL